MTLAPTLTRRPESSRLRLPLPLPMTGLLILAAAYCLLGLMPHDPWKTEDAIGIGIVHRMLISGGLHAWLVPNLAGEPYLQDGPLYYALAAFCAKVLSFALATHDGARLASALCIATTLWFLRAAGREFFSPVANDNDKGRTVEGDGAALIMIGTLGLFVHAHEVLAENGALAGMALAWYGLARARGNAIRGGLWFGLGIAIALWTKGPTPAIPVIVAALASPLLGSAWRTRAQVQFLAISAAIVLVVAFGWYAALHAQNAALPLAWWQTQYDIFANPTWERALEQLQLLSWATWPAWPLAAWALRERRHRLRNDAILPVAAAVALGLAMFLFTRDVNEVFAMPMMLPLALAAGAGVPALRRGAANALGWFGAMTFTTGAILVWLGWFAMMTGMPRQIALNFAKLEPGHVPQFGALAFAIATALTLTWVFLLWRSERSLHRCTAFWAAGVVLVWGLATTLWLPWIDYGKTYRPVATSLASILKSVNPGGARCIASRGLGEAQRAAFDYHAAIATQRLEIHERNGCTLLLIQARAGEASAPDQPGSGWRRVWEGNRPRDRERFRLYVRR